MNKILLLSASALFASSCSTASLDALSEANQTKFFTTSNVSTEFDEFLLAVRKDEISASNNSRQFQATGGALRYATLAVGIFGGYTTAFTNSVDIKEAGLIAASIVGLSGNINAGKNRDASRQAARRFDCLIREAQPFRSDFYGNVKIVSSSLTPVTISRGVRRISSNKLNKNWARTTLLDPMLVGDMRKVAPFRAQVESAVSDEEIIYNQRFDIAISTYRQIVRNWESSVESESQSYEQLLSSFQEAVKQNEEQEETQEETEDMARAVRAYYGNPKDIDNLAQVGTRYSAAKAAVVKCGGID